MGRWREYDSAAERVSAWRKRRGEYVKGLEQEKKKLEAEVERVRKVDGSLFDLKRDKTDDIVVAIVGVVTEHRGTAIARGILAHYKKAKPAGSKKAKPAG